MNSEWAEPPKGQGSSLATPGAQLAAQREAMGWTVEQIADQLKLAPRQVKALEAGDYAALPNMAVVRGFVRAYAKVVKIDATPLVAMIEVVSPTSHEAAPPRKEIAASFSESRFPSMTGRSSSGPAGWLVGVAVVVAVAAAGAYAWQTGLIPATLFERSKEAPASATTEAVKPADTVAPIETTLVKPGDVSAPVQSTNVPLISVPPQTAPAAADAAATTPATVPVATPATPAPAAAAPAAAGNQLVLKVTEDSWVEIRRPGTTSLISRLVKAGSTETFDIKDPALLIVGKPGGVEATLGGVPLPLPPVAGGTISRVNIK